MTEQQRPSNSDTQRSILQHLMFGVLFVLILMNWEVYRVPNYRMFEKSINSSNNNIEARSENYKNALTEIKEEEGYDYQYKMDSFALIIREKTKVLIARIDSFSHFLKRSNAKSFSSFESDFGNSILNHVSNYNIQILALLSIDSNYSFNRYNPLNRQGLLSFHYLISSSHLPLYYQTRESAILALVSLKNDVKVYENLILEQVFEKSLNGVLHCKFPKAIGFAQQNVLFMGETVNYQLIIGDYGFDDGKNFLHAEASEGWIDDSSFQTERLILWVSTGKNFGLNTITGNVIARVRKEEHKFPFSFSYFVSAPGIAFHLDKANVCYVGADNPISIHIPGYPAEKLKLKVAHAKVTKKENGLFEVYFDKIPKGKVYAYVDATNEQGRTSTVHSMELRVKDLPPPITNFDAFKESGMPVDSFFRKESLEIFAADSAFAIDYEVISFQVEGFTAKQQYFGPITVHGEEFSGNHELVSILNTISAGDRLIISDIRVRAANGRLYEAAPISVLLK